MTIMRSIKKRASGGVYCMAFGYLVIFNMINTNTYGMYPPSFLTAFAFAIGISMIMGVAWACVWDPGEKRRVDVTYRFEHMRKELALEHALPEPVTYRKRSPFSRPTASV